MTNSIIQSLTKQKKALIGKEKQINQSFNDPTETDREREELNKKISQEKINELNRRKMEREKERQNIVVETRHLIKTTFNQLLKMGIVRNKVDFSRQVLHKSPCFFYLIESDESRSVSYDTLSSLRDTLVLIKDEIKTLLKDEDIIYTDWVRRKLEDLIYSCDKLCEKVVRSIYGV